MHVHVYVGKIFTLTTSFKHSATKQDVLQHNAKVGSVWPSKHTLLAHFQAQELTHSCLAVLYAVWRGVASVATKSKHFPPNRT